MSFEEYTMPLGVAASGAEEVGKVVLRDVGASMMQIWGTFMAHTDAVMYMVDLTQPAQVSGAAAELMGLLRSEHFYRASGEAKPLLLVFTKADVRAPRVTLDAVAEAFRLPDLARALERGPPQVPSGPFGIVKPARAEPPPKSSSLDRLTVVAVSSVSGSGMDDVLAWIRATALDVRAAKSS
jgi:ADP-ribosylation factor family